MISNYLRSFLWFVASLLFVSGCGSRTALQDDIVANARLDALSDELYYMPANVHSNSDTLYLPIRKWDIIFTGNIVWDPSDPKHGMVNLLIPGRYNHISVYVGKDSDGFAYAVELNADELYFTNRVAFAKGGMRLMCLGTDYGKKLHASGRRIVDRTYYETLWAKTFTPSVRAQLLAHDDDLTKRVIADLRSGHPYQLEFELSIARILAADYGIPLVDDGFENGSGCADYWTTLFETCAGLCMTNVRASPEDLTNYFRITSHGRQAFLPPDYSPFGNGQGVYIFELLEMGFHIVPAEPHVFSSDGSKESGVVLPDKIFESDLLQEPEF